ncbi:MAG: YraN family protein [Bacteroidetes bacterium HGW-Bacteroidetes-12]|jgi:putative endonuclease|nr:MAG: YraN family protein [Bacteroidetes bacterium HGW-Bacteroidetes-12]
MAQHNLLGKKGEEKAVVFLKKLGYEILAINWQERKFEIDIIAKDQQELVFIEVKTRATDYFGTPEEAVTTAKQNHLIEGADYYIQKHEIDLEARFDVIAIVLNKQTFKITHFKAAFYP